VEPLIPDAATTANTKDAAAIAAAIDTAIEQTVRSIASQLVESYVFLDRAHAAVELLWQQAAANAYRGLTDTELATALTRDLQSVTHDKHLRVRGKEHQPLRENFSEPAATRDNYGFRKVEILDGNIGYIDFRVFCPVEWAGETAAAAMRFVSHTDALIFDLRKNGGGSPEMVAFLCSYLFSDRTHLNDMYWRSPDTTDQFWTSAYVPGLRYLDKPVYVLVSSYTFSGAEEFTYNLKNLKRASVIGETTGGGAHPGGWTVVGEAFEIFVPVGRAINPISKDNWEGTGIAPDIAVPADEALTVALAEIRNSSRPNEADPR